MSQTRTSLIIAASVAMLSLPVAAGAAGNVAHADLKPTAGSTTAGKIVFTQEGEIVKITGSVSGLTPGGKHGFHVHAKGDCSAADASSAGGHFHLDGQKHGAPGAAGVHVGDMGNIEANDKGVAEVDLILPATQMTLANGAAHNIIGRGLIVHKGTDDLKTQPTGDAGGRAACAVITAGK